MTWLLRPELAAGVWVPVVQFDLAEHAVKADSALFKMCFPGVPGKDFLAEVDVSVNWIPTGGLGLRAGLFCRFPNGNRKQEQESFGHYSFVQGDHSVSSLSDSISNRAASIHMQSGLSTSQRVHL